MTKGVGALAEMGPSRLTELENLEILSWRDFSFYPIPFSGDRLGKRTMRAIEMF